jgi:pyrroline-5-carboxylate reductase
MRVGFIGAGNMARALARGLGEPVLVSDPRPGAAENLAAEVGGEAVPSNGEVARRADVVFLLHKPAQLGAVAAELGPQAPAVVSVLGSVPLADVQAAYPGRPVLRMLPNLPVEVGRGLVVLVVGPEAGPELTAQVRELLGRTGRVVELEDGLVDAAMGLMSCGVGFLTIVLEAQADSAVRHGIPAELAAELAAESMAGTAALVAARGHDTPGIRRQVTSPGGSTARGLAALDRAGLRAAFQDAMDAVLARGPGR